MEFGFPLRQENDIEFARLTFRDRGPGHLRLFLIGRGREDTGRFLFYELFADEAAFAAHQASDHFKTLIAAEAVPLLAKRERAQYVLL